MVRKLLLNLLIVFTFFLPAIFNVGSVSASTSSDLINLVNQYRTGQNLGVLTADKKLTSASCWMAADMAVNNYFSHTDSLGRDPFTRMNAFGATAKARAENIASLTNQANSAQKIFTGWKKSSGHNANMLGASYTRIGVGFAYSKKSKTYSWVADFASGTATAGSTECSNPKPKPVHKTTTPAPKTSVKKTKPSTKTAPQPNTPQVLAQETKQTTTPTLAWQPYPPAQFQANYQNSSSKTNWLLTALVLTTLFLLNGWVLTKMAFALLASNRTR